MPKRHLIRIIGAYNIFIIVIILLAPVAYAPSVGVIPTTLDLGYVSRGEDVVGEMYLSTSSGAKFKMAAGYIRPVANPWFRDHISEYSEEDISGWLDFPEEVMDIDGTKSFPVTVGTTITRANKKVEFIIHIPKNAEPGYHAGSISFNPVTDKEKGAVVNFFAVVRPNFVFRVNGEVKRHATITKMEAERHSKTEAGIILYLKNTGTNTMSTDKSKSRAKIYNSNNEIRAELSIGSVTLKPGEEIPIGIHWQSKEEIKDGKYKVAATINYRSGETSNSAFVTVPSMIAIASVPDTPLDVSPGPVDAILSVSKCKTNRLLILSISLLIGLIIYWRMPHTSLLNVLLLSLGVFLALTAINYLLFCYRSIWSIIIIILLGIAIYYWKKE